MIFCIFCFLFFVGRSQFCEKELDNASYLYEKKTNKSQESYTSGLCIVRKLTNVGMSCLPLYNLLSNGSDTSLGSSTFIKLKEDTIVGHGRFKVIKDRIEVKYQDVPHRGTIKVRSKKPCILKHSSKEVLFENSWRVNWIPEWHTLTLQRKAPHVGEY